MTGIEQRAPKEQIIPDRSTAQLSVGFALSMTNPDHHDLEAHFDVLCCGLLGINTIRCDSYD